MSTQKSIGPSLSRRSFLTKATSLAAFAVASPYLWAADDGAAAGASKPNSIIDGVRIGCITYSFRGELNSAQDILQALIKDGISEVEMMDGPIRAYAGIHGGRGDDRPQPTDAEREAQLAKCREMRKLYNDAGVNIHLHKLPFGRSDEEIEFNFLVAKALGCIGITTERNDAQARKLAPFAEKHKIWVGFHNHTTNFPSLDNDPLPEIGPYIGFNLDCGHYFAGTKGKSPVPVIEKYHDHIVSLHLKDRTADGGNLPWGQGQTPIKEILQTLRREKYTFPADIELEYKIPQGSDSVAEVAKCLNYCKAALA
jgi:sugar phosphate isomerase/epimerase